MKRQKIAILMILCSLFLSSCLRQSTSNTETIENSIFEKEKISLMNRVAKQENIGDTLKLGLVGYPTNMNPFYADSTSSKNILDLLYEPLFYLKDENLNIQIQEKLLESFEINEDKTVYNLKIKDNAKWHDATPVTAGDIIYSIQYTIDKGDTIYKDEFKLDGVAVQLESTGDKSMRITLPRTSETFIYSLAKLTVVPQHLYSQLENKYISLKSKSFLVGNGPYAYDNTYYDTISFTDYLSFQASEHYYGEKPKLPNLQTKIVVHGTSARFEMLDYNVQGAYIRPGDAAPLEVAYYDTYDFSQGQVVSTLFKESGFFGGNPELKDAFVQALNVDSIKGIFGPTEYVTAANSIFSENNSYRISDSTFQDNNTEKAKDVLQKYSLEHPDKIIKFGFILDVGEPQERVAVTLQESFKRIGVDIELVPLYAEEFEAKLLDPKNDEFDVCLYSYPSDPNPDNYKLYFTGNSPTNLTGYHNPNLDELWKKADSEKDPIQRKVLYDEIQRIILKDKPVFPLVYIKTAMAMDRRIIHQEEANPENRGYFRNLEKLDKKEFEYTQEELDKYKISPNDLKNAPNNNLTNNRPLPLED